MKIPNAKDICVFGTLDEQEARKNFLGKSRSEAQELFEQNSCYFEDLMHMGPMAFCFYVYAAIDYIKTSEYIADEDLAWFLLAVQFQLEHSGDAVSHVVPDICNAMQFALDNWSRFDVEQEFYPDLNHDYRNLLESISAGQ